MDNTAHTTTALLPADLLPADLSPRRELRLQILDEDAALSMYDLSVSAGEPVILHGIPMLAVWTSWHDRDGEVRDSWVLGGERHAADFLSEKDHPGLPREIAALLADTPGSVNMRLSDSHLFGSAALVPLLPLLDAWGGFADLRAVAERLAAEQQPLIAARLQAEQAADQQARDQGFQSHEALLVERVLAKRYSGLSTPLLRHTGAGAVLTQLRAQL